jgi:hypothetical protein
MQVTAEYVEQVCRSNCIPIGWKYTMVIISHTKLGLTLDMSAAYRLEFLNRLDGLVNHANNTWLTADMVAAIDPMCAAGLEMFREAMTLDRGKPGRPGALDALAKFFPAFAVLNPSLVTALKMESRRSGYFRSVDQEVMPS